METKKLLPNSEDKKGFSCNGTEYFDPKQIYDLTQDSKFKECEKMSEIDKGKLEKRYDFYQRLANQPVQVKRQYFRGKADAFEEVLVDTKKDIEDSIYPIYIVSNDEKREELIAIPKSKWEEWFCKIIPNNIYIDRIKLSE